jgi:hypothetical protein
MAFTCAILGLCEATRGRDTVRPVWEAEESRLNEQVAVGALPLRAPIGL